MPTRVSMSTEWAIAHRVHSDIIIKSHGHINYLFLVGFARTSGCVSELRRHLSGVGIAHVSHDIAQALGQSQND